MASHEAENYEQIPRMVLLDDVPRFCTCYGRKKLIELIRTGQVDGGQLADNKSAWWIDLHDLLDHVRGFRIGHEAEDPIKARIRADIIAFRGRQ